MRVALTFQVDSFFSFDDQFDGFEQVSGNEMRLSRKIFELIVFGFPMTRHNKHRSDARRVRRIDIEIPITDEIGVCEVKAEFFLRAKQHPWSRFSAVASRVGMMRAEIDRIESGVVPAQFGLKHIVYFVNE